VTLTFDLLTLKVVSETRVTWTTCVPILASLFSSYSRCRLRDRHQTSDVRRRQTKASLNSSALTGRGHSNAYIYWVLLQQELMEVEMVTAGTLKHVQKIICI